MKHIITIVKSELLYFSIVLSSLLMLCTTNLNAEEPPKPSIEFTVVNPNTDLNVDVMGEGEMFVDRGNGYKYKIPLANGNQNFSKKGETIRMYGKIKELSFINSDVSSIKIDNCPTLEKLEIMNLPFAKINKIDASKNIKLKKLKCNGLDIMEIMLPNEECDLEDIDCSVNKLTKLDVSKCSKLVKLNVMLNKIGHKEMQKLVKGLNNTKVGKYEEKQFIVFSTNPAEGNVCSKSQVKMATDNGWRVISVKRGFPSDYEGSEDPEPAVDNRVITTLSTMKEVGEKLMIKVKGNEDISIDLGDGEKVDVKNTDNLQEFELKGKEIKLYGDVTMLVCENNKITKLDLANIPNLMNLDCSDNELTALDLSANKELEMLDICNNKITEAAMDQLIETLNSKKADKTIIVVSDKEVGNECKKEQVQVIKNKNWAVKQMKVSDNSHDLLDYEGEAEKSPVLSIDKSEVKVYPNPTTEYIYIDSPKANSTYYIYDIAGNLVQKSNISGLTKVSVGSLPNSIYFVKVDDKVYKVVKN